MAAIKVQGNFFSTAVQRVIFCLYEKGVDFQFVHVNMAAGEHKSENFLAFNPFGQVPVFEDGDLKLFDAESRAITHYLAHEYADKGSPLLIPGSNKEAVVLQLWTEVEAHQFNPPSSALVWELYYKPIFGQPTDAAVVEENEAKLGKVLDLYESRLSQSKYLAADYITLADLYHFPNIPCLMGTSAKTLLTSRPHVMAWATAITAERA